jgi:hypothetical protein
VIDVKIQTAFAEQVTGQFFGESGSVGGSVVDYLNLYNRAKNMTVADGFAVRVKNAQKAQDTARTAWNWWRSQITSKDMKMKTIKLAMAAASITLFTDKLAYTTYADALANPWQGLDLNETASLRDDAQFKLEEDLRESMSLFSALAADYVPWYVSQSGAGCTSDFFSGPICSYEDGGFHLELPQGPDLTNGAEANRFLKSQAYSRALRDLAPLYVLPKFVDKALPAVPPFRKASVSRVVNGPYHPYLFTQDRESGCCTNPNPLVLSQRADEPGHFGRPQRRH